MPDRTGPCPALAPRAVRGRKRAPRAARVASLALVAALASGSSTGCQPGPPVARLVDGHPIDDHFVRESAYAAYLEGTLAEATNPRAAAAAYERAVSLDPDAGEAWARLGALRCTTSPARANDAFRRAERRAPELGVVALAVAECALRRGRVAVALEAARRAARANPLDVETTRVLALALERSGDRAAAERHRRAAWLLHGETDGVAVALGLHAPQGPDAARAPAGTAAAELDRCLALGDAECARRAAVAARVPGRELALRALEAGLVTLARDAAELALAAAPGDPDARVVALVAADLARDDAALRAAARPVTLDAPLGVRARAELLWLVDRRTGTPPASAPPAGTGTRSGTVPTGVDRAGRGALPTGGEPTGATAPGTVPPR